MKKGTTKGRGGRSKQPPKVPPPKVQLPIVPDISGMTYDQINSLGDDIRENFSQEQEEYYRQLEEAESQRQVAEIAEAQRMLKPTDKHPQLINFNDTPYDQIIFSPPENPYNPKEDPLRWRLYENKTLDFKRRRREARTDLDIKRLQDDMDEFYEGEFDWDPKNAHQNDEVVRTMKTIANMRAFNQANDQFLKTIPTQDDLKGKTFDYDEYQKTKDMSIRFNRRPQHRNNVSLEGTGYFEGDFDPKNLRKWKPSNIELFKSGQDYEEALENWKKTHDEGVPMSGYIPWGNDNRSEEKKALRAIAPGFSDQQLQNFQNMIDLTLNNRKTIKFDRRLTTKEGADWFIRNRPGWEVQLHDVNPEDGLGQKEVIIYNEAGQPVYVDGYTLTNSKSGLYRKYYEDNPGGFDKFTHLPRSYGQWADEQFQYTPRKYPWTRSVLKEKLPPTFARLKEAGFKVPAAPREVLSVPSIWNKVFQLVYKNWLKQMKDQKYDLAYILDACVTTNQLATLLYTFYVDGTYFAMLRKAGYFDKIFKQNRIPTWKEYKKKTTGKKHPGAATFRRWFYQVFVNPPNKFNFSAESINRAIHGKWMSRSGQQGDSFALELASIPEIQNGLKFLKIQMGRLEKQEKLKKGTKEDQEKVDYEEIDDAKGRIKYLKAQMKKAAEPFMKEFLEILRYKVVTNQCEWTDPNSEKIARVDDFKDRLDDKRYYITDPAWNISPEEWKNEWAPEEILETGIAELPKENT